MSEQPRFGRPAVPRWNSGARIRPWTLAALAVGGVGLVSCDVGTSFVEPDGGRIENLEVRFEVEPDTLRAGDRFSAVMTLRNPSRVGVAVDLAGGCLGEPAVFGPHRSPDLGAERPLEIEEGCQVLAGGATWVDADGAESYSIPPGDSLVQRWSMTAWLRYPEFAPYDLQVPRPGSHVVRLATASTLPTLDAVFEVLGSGYYWNMMRCGFIEPNLQDTLVVDIRAPEAIRGLYNHPFRVYNHTDQDILLRRISSSSHGGEPYRIKTTTERQTPEGGWEHHRTDYNPFWGQSHPFLLRPGECVQSWNPVSGPPGTYRIVLGYAFEGGQSFFAHSGPVVIPEG